MGHVGKHFGIYLINVSRGSNQDWRNKEILCATQHQQVWWRANESMNSVANLVLHLAGNLRQWIVHGVGGAPDVRQR